MANTVNDVMNVIANPDYGIRNIAGTNQEILAIMQGTHNSKNNIYNIVDDVRNLLQKLVDANPKKKSVEVSGNNQTKINHRHIQDILDETKGIRKAIDNLSKALLKQKNNAMPAVAKLSNKASEMVAKAMTDNINKNKGGGLSSLINTFGNLKNISFKDILVGKMKLKLVSKIIDDLQGKLNIDKDELSNVIKIINSAPELVKSLNKIGWGVNRIIRKNIIGKLSDILTGKESILSISQILQKNEKVFNKATKISISLKELITMLNKSMWQLLVASTFAKASDKGIKYIEMVLDKLIPLSEKLTKNKNNIDKGSKIAKNLTILSGNLFISTIFLSTIAITGVPALLGATLLEKTIDKLIPTITKLSESKKHIKNAAGSALYFTAVTGLMSISSLFLSTIAVTGAPALLGSVFMLGIVKICTSTFKMLGKAKKSVLIGSIVMVLMSTSLLLFGVALKKIVDATKGVTFKQVGIIAAMTALLGGSVALLGIPAVFPFIALGSISMAIMGFALRPFAKTLSIISKETEKLKIKQVTLLSGAMSILALGVAKMALLSVPVLVGSKTLGKLSRSLRSFAKSLKEINSIGSLPNKQIYQVLNAMKSIANFFKENKLKKKVIKTARRYKRILRPFATATQYLSKLKELGVIPMKLVYQTLNAMREISNYYKDNPIRKKAIRQAEKYKDMLKPFGKVIKHFVKLKELGVIPMKLVYQTLNTMSTIANYYMENPIRKKAIRQANKYKKMLKPFGNTIKHLVKLKELGVIPMKLVYQTLNIISTISDFYKDKNFKSIKRKDVRNISVAVSSFCKSVVSLSKLKDLKNIPVNTINNLIEVVSNIKTKGLKKNIRLLSDMVSAVSNLSNINSTNITSIDSAISNTLNGVNAVDMDKIQAVTNMFNAFNGINKSENAINKFTESVKEFTKACKNLMDAMNSNTDAINNIDNNSEDSTFNESRENNIIESNTNNSNSTGINIANVDELARTIAEKINGVLSVDIPDTQVQLLINGTGGNEWTISRY